MVSTRNAGKQAALVTGGAGFLGEHLVRQLLASGGYDVTVFDPVPCDYEGATCVVGDISKPQDVLEACRGKAIVFHVASAAPTAQNAASARDLMNIVNVHGTANLLTACRKCGVRRFVYTSSASVVFAGEALVDVDERCPYAATPMDFYTGTKLEAERMVLQANSESLATCALRPSGIFGPGKDRLLVPSVAQRCRSGKMRYIIGRGTNLFDWTYVGNVAEAHLCAAAALAPDSAAAGEAFFITNDEPEGFWAMLGDLAEGLGYPRPSVHLPVWLMMVFAYIAVFVAQRLAFHVDLNPMRVCIASVQRTMSCAKAKRVLGYAPRTSMRRGKELTLAHFQHLHKDAQAVDKEA